MEYLKKIILYHIALGLICAFIVAFIAILSSVPNFILLKLGINIDVAYSGFNIVTLISGFVIFVSLGIICEFYSKGDSDSPCHVERSETSLESNTKDSSVVHSARHDEEKDVIANAAKQSTDFLVMLSDSETSLESNTKDSSVVHSARHDEEKDVIASDCY